MFKHEVGPGGVTFVDDESAVAPTAEDSPAATRLTAIPGASARIEIRNRILPSGVRITPTPSLPRKGGGRST